MSKLHTAYALLITGGVTDVLNGKVVKYLPELLPQNDPEGRDDLTSIHWQGINIGALMSHQGGIGGAGPPSL